MHETEKTGPSALEKSFSGNVAKREPGPLEQVLNEQHRTRELLAALQSKLSPVTVPVPEKDQGDRAEPVNQLFSALQQQRDINARLHSVLESIAL